MWVSSKESRKGKASEQELSMCFQHWPENPSVLPSWQVNPSLEMDGSALMTPDLKVIQLPPPAPIHTCQVCDYPPNFGL